MRAAPDSGGGAPAAVVEPVAAAPEVAPVAPAAEAPAAAPVADPSAEPAAPVAEPAKDTPAPEPKPEDAKPAVPSTLLGEAVKADKPADAAKPDPKPADAPADAKPADGADPVAPAYDFKFPEGVKADKEQLAAYTDILGKNNVPPEVGQALLDQHTAALTKFAEHVSGEQQRVWQETNARWKEEAKADPEIGGAGFETSMKAAARMLELVVKTEEMGAVNQMLEMTGAGNNPLMLKMFVRFAKLLDEPAAPAIQGMPAKTNGKAPGKGRLRDIYAGNEAARKAT